MSKWAVGAVIIACGAVVLSVASLMRDNGTAQSVLAMTPQEQQLADQKADLDIRAKDFALQKAFVAQFGVERTILSIAKPTDLFVFVWDDPRQEGVNMVTRHFTLYLDGLFTELGQVKVTPTK